ELRGAAEGCSHRFYQRAGRDGGREPCGTGLLQRGLYGIAAMIRHKRINQLCIRAMALAVVLTVFLYVGEDLGIRRASAAPEYAFGLFDVSRVHTVDLQVEDWAQFLAEAPMEEYVRCTVVIDGEAFHQVGLRAKGNNSRRLTEEYGLARYSLKLGFDHYVDGGSYHGLDKLQLQAEPAQADRKSTRLHSSHVSISYAVFCLIKQNK